MLYIFLVLLCSWSLTLVHADLGITCNAHPAFRRVKNPVLIRSWQHVQPLSPVKINSRLTYMPRFSGFSYKPLSGSQNYQNLDMYFQAGFDTKDDDATIMTFQRPAKVYLFVNAYMYTARVKPPAYLPGWKSEGWAARQTGGNFYKFGIHQHSTIPLSDFAYVFSRPATNQITIPYGGWIMRNIKGINAQGQFHLRIAEANGAASAPPTMDGQLIKPNAVCPGKVHDTWRVPDSNTEDPHTKGMLWGSWHPQWDPCFWCAYDHEHGSAAPYLMGYKPMYGRTEWKNGQEIEPHPGFKDVVFRHGPLIVYISSHAQTSSLRRVMQRVHTLTIVVKNFATKELLVELTMKADYGFNSARKVGEGNVFIPLSEEFRQMKAKMLARKPPTRDFRSINVINMANLDPRFKYVNPKTKGTYEEWVTNPPCTAAAMNGELTLDILDPVTGIKDFASKQRVWLGVQTKDGFLKNAGVRRRLIMKDFRVSAKLCRFGPNFKGGYFYTDPHLKQLRSGPQVDSIRQFIKPGFDMTIRGMQIYRPTGRWLGMHQSHTTIMYFRDQGYGINPAVN